ncbi:zinc finger protein, putative [Bodo saltans]|uniref:Zinc finger protein, putative n=1 Tax=Bodo saltans TaxID=75058 RepID=A0A0S4IWH0_BODSA|nr:zinc finger protein, putative [Bodo saltans]|eukprot:CUF98884.1 zinc finger protein, putative [Bodo saltans]
MMRLLHQTLRERLDQANEAVSTRGVQVGQQRFVIRASAPPGETNNSFSEMGGGISILDAFQLPQQLEEMMMMRAIALSLQQIQPSSAPPPISGSDSAKLERVVLSDGVIERLKKHDHPECPICQEDFSSKKDEFATRLPCDHVFCVGCLRKWLESSRTCPVCRLELVDVETLYDTHSSSPSRKKSVLAITPPPTPPIFSRAQNQINIVNTRPPPSSSSFVSAPPQPRTPPRHYVRESDAYFQPGVGSQQRQTVAELRQAQSGIVADSSGESSDGFLSGEESEGEHTTEQQALLDEILRRRNEQQLRTVLPSSTSTNNSTLASSSALLPPRSAIPPTATQLSEPTTPIDPPRRSTGAPTAIQRGTSTQRQPVPPVQTRNKSTPRTGGAVAAVGRVRPAPRPSEPATPSPSSVTTATAGSRRPNAPSGTSTVGVRGLLTRTRSVSSSTQQ